VSAPLIAVTVTVPVCAVAVDELELLEEEPPPPPQFTNVNAPTASRSVKPSILIRRRLDLCPTAKQRAATPPVSKKNWLEPGRFLEVVEGCETVSVAVPLVETVEGETAQVVPTNVADVVQLKVTVPVNPFRAATVKVEVADDPRAKESEAFVSVKLKSGLVPPTEGHDATSAPTSTVPSPVTRSYPVPVLKPIVPVVQFGVPVVHGTMLSPTTMS
jgi:hypothetical protein